MLWRNRPLAYETSELDRFEEFQELRREWNALLAESVCPVPFLRHEWLSLWWTHFGAPNRLAIVLVREGGRLVLAAPLMEAERRFLGRPFHVLQSLTNFHSPRYHLLVRRGDDGPLDAFWAHLARRSRPWHLLYLNRIPRGKVQRALAARATGHRSTVEIVPSLKSPYLPINETWDSYLSTLKPKFRSNLRNRSKRLQTLGEVTFDVVQDAAAAPAALEMGLEIEASGWKGARGSAIRADAAVTDFYRRLTDVAASEGWLRLSLMRVAGHPAAFDLSLVYEGRMYCLKIGYDPKFSPYSAGQLLCRQILRSAHEQSLGEYDFLGERSVQKRDWTPEAREHVALYVYNPRLLSRLHRLQRFTARRTLKRVLPKGVVAALKARLNPE